VIPRLITRPVTVCRWLLLALLVAAAAASWWVTVPTSVRASGVIVGPRADQSSDARTTAVLLLPPDEAVHVRVGRPVHIQLGSSGTDLPGAVAAVEPGVVTPDTARRRDPALGPDLVTQPSVVIVVQLENPPSSAPSAGTQVTGQVQTDPQRLIALLPGLASRSGS
jgi:hypothetical protein